MPPIRAQVAAFGYHEVTDRPTETGFQRPGAVPYRLGTAAFRQHLDVLGGGPVKPRPLESLDLEAEGRHLLITFDDGGKSALQAADLLEERGWRGEFFIVTSLIGTAGFLDAGEVRALHDRGHGIGSHSHTHPDIFAEQDPARMLDEWRRSRGMLEQIIGAPVVTASVPGGVASRVTYRTAAEAGLTRLLTSEPRLRPWVEGECRVFGRFIVKAKTRDAAVRNLARFRGWGRARITRELKKAARRSFPFAYRRLVRYRTLPFRS